MECPRTYKNIEALVVMIVLREKRCFVAEHSWLRALLTQITTGFVMQLGDRHVNAVLGICGRLSGFDTDVVRIAL